MGKTQQQKCLRMKLLGKTTEATEGVKIAQKNIVKPWSYVAINK